MLTPLVDRGKRWHYRAWLRRIDDTKGRYGTKMVLHTDRKWIGTTGAERPVRLYVVEEQAIYKELFRVVFDSQSGRAPIEALGIAVDRYPGSLLQDLSTFMPDVLLLGTKKLDKPVIQELQQVREEYPGLGIVILPALYDGDDIRLARKLTTRGRGGLALFLKQSLDGAEELCRIVMAVNQGQVILDPNLVKILFQEKPEYPFMKQLTPRELEILGLLAKGYTNVAIADLTYTDVKTVENHINTLYSKLKAETALEQRNPRVVATRIYMSAMEDFAPFGLAAGAAT